MQVNIQLRDAADVASYCEEYLYIHVICHAPFSKCTACTASESIILWGAAQVLGWMVGVCGGREKTTESLGTNGDGIHVFALRQTFDSVRPFFALVPWMDNFFGTVPPSFWRH